MYHPAQQMEEPLSRRGGLSAHKGSMTLDLDNAGPSQPTSVQAHTSSPLPTPDFSMPLLTTPEFEMLLADLKVPETPPMQTTVLPLNQEEKQRWSRFVDEFSNLNLPQQQQHTQQQPPPPVFQQHVRMGANGSDSNASTSNASSSPPPCSEHCVTGDHVKGKTQAAVRTAPPLCYIISDEDSSSSVGAQRMAMHEAPQELSRCEASSLSMRIMSLDMNNAGPHQHNSEQARMTHAVSRPHAVAPLSQIDIRNGKGAKLEDKKCRNRIAQARCRQRKIDRVTFLQGKVRKLKLETAALKSTANSVRYQVELLRQQWVIHARFCGLT
ncbi:transcription factor Jun-like [Rhipicephalus microplus]|uniref:transcription factor Jun-like n=1 Tax=Rhipicephalus microplus TaxID=6941 RepID=UPI003F6D3241